MFTHGLGPSPAKRGSGGIELDGVQMQVSDRTRMNREEGGDDERLGLYTLLELALVPATVPAGVLLIALAIAQGLGVLPPTMRSLFEQVAGGALLITYLKEIFPQVLERLDTLVDALGPTTAATKRAKHRRWFGLVVVVVLTTVASVVVQAAAERFPGMRSFNGATVNVSTSVACAYSKAGRSTDSGGTAFTPGDTVPYFLGFFVDGVVLAYSDDPIACDAKLVKRMVLSTVLAVDNFLDGFGLAPVLREAFHEAWWCVMLLFAGCVLFGAISTALLRWIVPPDSIIHTVWFCFATCSILDGAMELCQRGLTVYVVLGMAFTWLFLFLGDVADDEEEDVGSHQRANDILSGMLSRSGSEASNANIEVARAAANRPLSHRDGSGHSVLSDSQRA